MEVTADDVASVVSAWTGIPVAALSADESAALLHLEDRLHSRVGSGARVRARVRGPTPHQDEAGACAPPGAWA